MERVGRRRERRDGRCIAEIEIDKGFVVPRRPDLGFAAAVREPLVKLHRPTFEFERWDWGYFAWPHDRPDANLEMRDSDPKATFEADREASEGFLNRNTTQLLEKDEQEQENEDGLFVKQPLLLTAPWPCLCRIQPSPGAWQCNALEAHVHTSLTA